MHLKLLKDTPLYLLFANNKDVLPSYPPIGR